MKAVHFFQITAFGSGPYDGKTMLLDHLVAGPLTRRTGTPASRKMENDGEESLSDKRAAILRKRAARLREPRILKRGEPVDMFDGKTLDGWFTSPRVYVPRNEMFASMPSDRLYDEVIRFYEENEGGGRIPNKERVKNRGVWEVKDGAVIGGQVPGSIAGSYLISEKTYGDFELTLEANPDFPIDTGIMVRAHKLGSVGYQVLVDNRPNGSIGGVYGNSVGSFLAWPFTIDGDEEPGNKIANIREGVVESNPLRGGKFKSDYSGTFAEFKKAWKPNDWNKIKVRCTGRLPLIETWVNGVLVSRLDTATLADVVPNYDAEAIFNRIGRKGHIAFEVHDSPTRQRWAPGAKCRWRNVRIRELEVDETRSQRTFRFQRSTVATGCSARMVNRSLRMALLTSVTTERSSTSRKCLTPAGSLDSTPMAMDARLSFGMTCLISRAGIIWFPFRITEAATASNLSTSLILTCMPDSKPELNTTAL